MEIKNKWEHFILRCPCYTLHVVATYYYNNNKLMHNYMQATLSQTLILILTI